jgi:hypothetical protein
MKDSIKRQKQTDVKKQEKDNFDSKKMTFTPKINDNQERQFSLAEKNFFNRIEHVYSFHKTVS